MFVAPFRDSRDIGRVRSRAGQPPEPGCPPIPCPDGVSHFEVTISTTASNPRFRISVPRSTDRSESRVSRFCRFASKPVSWSPLFHTGHPVISDCAHFFRSPEKMPYFRLAAGRSTPNPSDFVVDDIDVLLPWERATHLPQPSPYQSGYLT